MKVTLVINDNNASTIELGYEEIATIVSSLADKETNVVIFDLLGKHSSVNVREAVASKDKLSEATVMLLANDAEVAVSRSLVRSEKAREYLTTEQLTAMSKRDVDTAENIAGYVEAYKNADADELADALSQHSDPRVRCALASNSGTAKKLIKKLTNDSDRKVQAAARETLNNC